MKTSLQHTPTPSQPRSISLPTMKTKYTRLLGGPAGTVSMRSGCVELLPGESIGMHSTEDNEELLVTLAGIGELCSPGMEPLPMHSGCVLYNPPHTLHDVVNTGDQTLRYIYVAAKAYPEKL